MLYGESTVYVTLVVFLVCVGGELVGRVAFVCIVKAL